MNSNLCRFTGIKSRHPDMVHAFPNGESCGSQRRRTDVVFQCCNLTSVPESSSSGSLQTAETNLTYLASVSETSTCHYSVTVCTSMVCYPPAPPPQLTPMTEEERIQKREEVREMFTYSYVSKKKHICFLPYTCTGTTTTWPMRTQLVNYVQ